MSTIFDLFLQATGLYRLSVWLNMSSIAWSASVVSPSRLAVARNVSIQRGCVLHCGGKIWCDYGGYVRLGTGSTIGPYCIVYGAGGIELHEHVHLGPGVKIMSQAGRHDRNRVTSHPTFIFDAVTIGAGTWIGAGAVILGGSRIGRCVSVAPNSVVSGDVPDYAVVSGNPARVMFKNEIIE